MDILIIEDDHIKYGQIDIFLRSTFSDINIVWKKSYQSGLRELVSKTYDLVLLDMSMHVYDKSPDETGGSFEMYAGQTILREIDMLDIVTKVIVVTMFDVFADGKSLIQLKDELRNEFGNFYIDTVFYSSSQDKWRLELKSLIQSYCSNVLPYQHDHAPVSVLLVDDTEYKISSVELMLGDISTKLMLTTAKDRISATKLLKKNKYDLAIIDMMLPDREGDSPSTDGGEMLLNDMYIDDSFIQPNSIIVLTAYTELQTRFRELYEDVAVVVFNPISDQWKEALKRRVVSILKAKRFDRKIIYCEDTNDQFYNKADIQGVVFRGLKGGSRNVYLAAKNEKDKFALRDRDYLTSNEIVKLQKAHSNYFILEYYCFENYIFHPDNIGELCIADFDKEAYKIEITRQKNEKLMNIVQDYKTSRLSYYDFIDNDKNNMDKNPETEIVESLKSDDFETFYPFFDMKGTTKNKGFDASCIANLNLNKYDLVSTAWFKSNISKLLSGI